MVIILIIVLCAIVATAAFFIIKNILLPTKADVLPKLYKQGKTQHLIKSAKQIISKEQIYDKIWGIDTDFESNNLEVYLSFVRKKLKIIDSDVTIKAIRCMGYKLEV